jgi:cell division protein FtsI (penicillin-binding protein 3)
LEIKKDILWRVYLCFIGLIILGIVVIGKVTHLQFIERDKWLKAADSLQRREELLTAERGTIYADEGEMLSSSIPFFDVRLDFRVPSLREKNGQKFNKNIDTLAYCLAKLFNDKSKASYKQELKTVFKEKKAYYLFKRKINYAQYQAMCSMPLISNGPIKSGFNFETIESRMTPFQLLANRTIGLNRNEKLSVGLERYYDSVLSGQRGKRIVQRLGRGGRIPVDGSTIEPVNGSDVITTLNVQMQDVVETSLYNMLKRQDAIYGTAVVMEVKTGRIKAIANLGKQKDGSYWEDNNYALMPTEPGSTMKLLTLLAAFEDGYTNMNDQVVVGNGTWAINGRTIEDDSSPKSSVLTIKNAFAASSNVAMSKTAYLNYNKQPKKYLQHLYNLGFNKKTGIDLADPNKLPNPDAKDWNNQALASMGFGYEIRVSPIHLLMLYNAVANNGVMMKPQLVSQIVYPDGQTKQIDPVVVNKKVCSKNTLNQLHECLKAVCDSGTVKKVFDSSYYSVAGKTGTTKVDDAEYDYDDRVYQSSFVGYFPANNPEYTCIVVVKNKPKVPRYHGGEVAAPVFKEISDHLMTMKRKHFNKVITYSIKVDTTASNAKVYTTDAKSLFGFLGYKSTFGSDEYSTITTKANNIVTGAVPLADKNVMPDVRGMGLKDALWALETRGIKVQINGNGKVREQSILPNTIIKKNITVVQLSLKP